MPSPNQLEQLVARVGQLYSLPAVAIEVLELTNHAKVDIPALKRCIEKDPALVSKILRVVNSSLFGLSRQVSDLNQALALLGIKPLKLLVLGFSLSDGRFSASTNAAADHYWRHALTQAVAARELAEQHWKKPGDEPFITALLADLGMLILLQELSGPYGHLVRKAAAAQRDLATLERESLGFEHGELTVRMLESWKFPASMIGAIRQSRRPGEFDQLLPRDRLLPEIVHLARLVADLLVDGRYDTLRELIGYGGDRHGLSQADLARLTEGIQAKISPLADVFALKLPDGVDYRDVLCRAHAQLAKAAEATAAGLIKPRSLAEADLMTEQLLQETQSLAQAAAELARAPRSAPARSHEERPHGVAPPLAMPSRPPEPGAPSRGKQPAATGRSLVATEPQLVPAVGGAIAQCRANRAPLSLVLLELSGGVELLANLGPIAAERLLKQVRAACQACDPEQAQVVPTAEWQFAVVIADCERGRAVRAGNDLIRQVEELTTARPVLASVGVSSVALPPKNFRATDLIESAGRCLSAALLSGGGVLKSIEIY